MIKALRRKIDNLVHGDDGAALIITLALFMLLYIACAGVFAIGQTVKEKMILQNAVDAAAYSAAIVQADTLSRIAALNREMAWTYKNLVCHQMDYISAKWLKAACDHPSVPEKGYEYYKPPASERICADYGATDNKITLIAVSTNVVPESEVYSNVKNSEALNLASKIREEKETISLLNASISDLISNLGDRMERVAKDVLVANLPDTYSADCFYSVKAYNYDSWSEIMTAGDEEAFLGFVGEKSDAFGNTYWFPLDASSLMRSYKRDFNFHSEWVWYDSSGNSYQEKRNYNALTKLGEDVNGKAAYPRRLKKAYFGVDSDGIRRGAISVGVAKYNRNPWARAFGRAWLNGTTRGLYEVFQPLIGTIDWTWAVASAQAGYIDSRAMKDDERKSSYAGDHEYNVDWEDGNWNLRTDNWDAVHVPVCQSFKANEFEEWIKNEGEWQKLAPGLAERVGLPDYDLKDMDRALPNMHNGGNTEGDLHWDELLKRMYH